MVYSNIHIKKIKAFILSLILVFLFSGINAQPEFKEVEAKNGDGIFILLQRYGLPSELYDDFIALNKPALANGDVLITGRKYKLPVTSEIKESNGSGNTSATCPIFGKDYEKIDIKSSDLKGAVYYLVAGHGGPDPGAMGKYGNDVLCEDEYAYDVTLRLAKSLMEQSATVYMITQDPNDGIRDESILKPDKDEICYPDQTIPLNQLARLNQRTTAVNKLYAKNRGRFQRMIAIHVDARSKGENIDVFYYYDERSNTGKKAAEILQQTFEGKYNEHQPSRGYHGTVSARNLYEVKNTYPATVYIELGNINHHRDQQRFIITDNRQAIANWLTLGLIKDFNTNK